jgi:DNA-binding GntR family transcriptional regulator
MNADELAAGGTPKLVIGPSLADQAYVVLRDMITSGELTYGERLTERKLAARLGVSQTPVREAIVRLEHERLLTRSDSRSLQVIMPTLRQLREMALIQASLRGLGARLAATNADATDVEEIVAAFEMTQTVKRSDAPLAESVARSLELNRRFHRRIDLASHNPSLIDMIDTSIAFDWQLRLRAVQESHRTFSPIHGVEEHRAIVRAIQDGDGDRAERLARAHALNGSENYLRQATKWPELA